MYEPERELALRRDARRTLAELQADLTDMLRLDPTMPAMAFVDAFLVGADMVCEFEEETLSETVNPDGSWHIFWSGEYEAVTIAGTIVGVRQVADGHFDVLVDPVWPGARRVVPSCHAADMILAL